MLILYIFVSPAGEVRGHWTLDMKMDMKMDPRDAGQAKPTVDWPRKASTGLHLPDLPALELIPRPEWC